MDIIKQLQVIFWILALALAAPPVLRHFDIKIDESKVRKVLFLPPKAPQQKEEITQSEVIETFNIPQRGKEPSQQPLPHSQRAVVQKKLEQIDQQEIRRRITGLEQYAALEKNPEYSTIDVPPLFTYEPFQNKLKWIGPPLGFTTKEIYSFMIYRERFEVTPSIASLLSRMHGNLMLDLLPFTMVVKPSKKLVVLFNDRKSYSSFTNRPPWSGASCDIARDTLYLVESQNLYPLSVHELTHLYFDGFFLPKATPLWLSEGMAVYMQSRTDEGRPQWLDRSIEKIKKGTYIPLEDFVKITSLESYNSAAAELWYAQSYSLVDYMMNMRTRDDFYKFCVNLKEDMPDYQALYRAYGLPFTKFETLESVWLHDLRKGKNDAKK